MRHAAILLLDDPDQCQPPIEPAQQDILEVGKQRTQTNSTIPGRALVALRASYSSEQSMLRLTYTRGRDSFSSRLSSQWLGPTDK